jgi:lysozyme
MSFTSEHRSRPLWETVAYKGVPIFRALALALDHAEEAGAQFSVLSADRRDRVLKRFNQEAGTHLHGQQYLYDHQHDPGFFAANRPGTTSHCLFADGNPAYRVANRVIPAGGKLPGYFLGIDVCDHGSNNDCSRLISTLQRLGYHVTRPYHSGAEAHHFSFTNDPTPVLRFHKRVPQAAPAKAAPAGKAMQGKAATATNAATKKPAAIPKPRAAAKPAAKKPAAPAKQPLAAKISRQGCDFIARHEGVRLGLYNDPVGHATIGVGHLVHMGPINGTEPAEFRKGITRERALQILEQDCGAKCKAVKALVKVRLTQHQLDALVSFTFNVGEGNLAQSGLLRELNAGRYDAVPGELTKWVKGGTPLKTLPGLVKRREAEGQLFRTGAYA